MSIWSRFSRLVSSQVAHLRRDPHATEAPVAKPPEREPSARPHAAASEPVEPPLAIHYRRLEVPYGAPWSEVRRAYRRLLRSYHPDLHASDPSRQKAAERITGLLNESYEALEKALSR